MKPSTAVKISFLTILIIGLLVYISSPTVDNAEIPDGDIMEVRVMEEFTLTSSVFSQGGTIPDMYTCDGENVNPPLSISNIPEGTKSLALIVDDPDIPEAVKKSRLIDKFDHLLIYNIPISEVEINSPYDGAGIFGNNSLGEAKYTGPCPPTEHEPTEHRYVFQLYALDSDMPLRNGAKEDDLRAVMKGHILAKIELTGLYDRANKN